MGKDFKKVGLEEWDEIEHMCARFGLTVARAAGVDAERWLARRARGKGTRAQRARRALRSLVRKGYAAA